MAKRVRALVVFDDAKLIRNAKTVAALALKHRLYSCGFRDFAPPSGLLGYGRLSRHVPAPCHLRGQDL
ncbi:MAG TPA: hypothetical protein VNZ53_49975 [Steroidobacteraceae bacterium]|nr:hypothetical protein [Steroidobacteraceae bacterium]